MGREQKGVHLMEDEEKLELTRRGFVVLAASAFGAFFIKPPLVAASGDKEYLVSIQTIGYGYLWPEEDEDDVPWETGTVIDVRMPEEMAAKVHTEVVEGRKCLVIPLTGEESARVNGVEVE